MKIAGDGEILCRGHNIMKGYYGNDTATRAAIRNGWFHTGDVGNLDDDGFLRITDRKKDLLVTAGGKNVAPQVVEGKLKSSAAIAELVLVGDGRPYLAALVAPDFDHLRSWCGTRGIDATTPDAIAANEAVVGYVQAEVDRLAADFAPFERPRRIAVVPAVFSIEGGELTPTLKVRRRVVTNRYADRIEALYAA